MSVWIKAAVGFVAFVLTFNTASAQQVIKLGVDPAFIETIAAGAAAWEEAGAADFVIIEGCGNGDWNVCWGVPANPAWVAGTIPSMQLIEVYWPELFSVAVACHELGHLLGLHYERYDDLSCMHFSQPTHAYPDEIDLANLGLTMPEEPVTIDEEVIEEVTPTPTPEPTPRVQLHDGTGGPLMPLYDE